MDFPAELNSGVDLLQVGAQNCQKPKRLMQNASYLRAAYGELNARGGWNKKMMVRMTDTIGPFDAVDAQRSAPDSA
jgi:hypothetical protein